MVLRHNSLRDVFVESCHRACLGGQVEVGCGLGLDRLHSGQSGADPEFFCEGGAKGRGVNNHGLGVATQYSA